MYIVLYDYKFIAIKGHNCKTTLSSYLMVTLKHGVLRPNESEDEQ